MGHVVAISSLVMRGSVGLRAAQFALERRGHTVTAMPTVLMPWHPGFGPSTRTVVHDLPTQLEEFAATDPEADAVLTGYFASAAQVRAAAAFLRAVKARRPRTRVVVDPVMGDDGGRYVPDEVAQAIAGELVPLADVITPNAWEMADLSGCDDPLEGAQRLKVQAVMVTSAPAGDDSTGALLVDGAEATLAVHERLARAPRGTGDLFAGVVTAALASGASPREALHAAASATHAVVSRSGAHDLAFVAAQELIATPPLRNVTLEPISGPNASEPAADWRAAHTVYGADGCRGGWVVVQITAEGPLAPEAAFMDSLAPLIGRGVLAVDIPIGLPERIVGAGRGAEQAARAVLKGRTASVFSMPSRSAVEAASWEEACARAEATSEPPRKISRQGFMLFPAIRAVDALLTPDNQESVFECHAELAFWRLNGEAPMPSPKRVNGVPPREALAGRIALLVDHGYEARFFDERPAGVPLGDLVDAAAIALIARRCREGTARPFPDPPQIDARGLRAAIWA